MAKEYYLIVGLGNPGDKYNETRHNAGFLAIDHFANYIGCKIDKQMFNGLYCKTKYKDRDIILLKPQTFMNLSGECVWKFVSYYKIDIDNVLIINDDLDLDVGRLRLRTKGSAGGHNGLKSIFNCLSTTDIKRLKIGIGKPQFYNTVDYVLSKFNKEELELLEKSFNIINSFLECAFISTIDRAMSLYIK